MRQGKGPPHLPNDDEFDALPEGDILGQPDGLGIAAPEGTGPGNGDGVVMYLRGERATFRPVM